MMAQRRQLDMFTKGRIVGKLESSRSQTEVSRILNVDQSVISRLWQRFQKTGDVTRQPVSGRPRFTTPLQDRHLYAWDMLGRQIAALSHPPSSVTELKRALQEALNRLSLQLVHHLIASVGTSGSKRCHVHEDQAQDALDRPVVEKTNHIVRNARVQPTASSSAIQAQVAPSVGSLVSSRTIRRRLAEGHLGSRRPIRVMPLNIPHRQIRLEWCHARGKWTAAEWNQVVFSDKSKFNLSSDNNRVRVW
ncbi:transposable element Tcb2 transposase [Trichonephila clavipes]|nr:transposable element Tcb2 transposase [Trichonephila clavipes]